MTRLIYSAIYLMALPLFFWSQYAKRPREMRKLWMRQKLGRLSQRSDGSPLLWVHAVSVGEAVAAATFIGAFTKRHPDYRIVVSTITDTGRSVAMDRIQGHLGQRAEVIYLPFDLAPFVRNAVRALRPSLFVVMETELWPNLFYCMKEAGVPVALLNGRVSHGSFSSYRKIGRFLGPVLDHVSLFSMQDPVYARRIIEMGAESSRVHSTGSFKFDIRLQRNVIHWTRGLKRPIVVAGSTHRGEEEMIARVFKGLLSEGREASLILVPRHPERADEVEVVLRSHGLSFARRSEIGAAGQPGVEVVLVDTVGELASVYSEADLAIMGGSFVPHGGQNPLEPAYWSKPVVCGPHMENFPFIEEFYEAGAAVMSDEKGLAGTLSKLLDSENMRRDMGMKASEILEGKRGAVERALDLVDRLVRVKT